MNSETMLTQAQGCLWQNNGLDLADLTPVLDSFLSKGADYADLYFEHSVSESWSLEDGMVKDAGFNLSGGVGVRGIQGEKTGFSYSDQVDLSAVIRAADAACSVLSGSGGVMVAPQHQPFKPLYSASNPLDSLSRTEKVALLENADKITRGLDSRVVDVSVSLNGSWKTVLVLASDGTLAADVRPLIRFGVSVILQQNGKRERGSSGGGARTDFSLLDHDYVTRHCQQAVHMAQVNLDAVEAPAGTMPVVLAPGWPGVLLHEAVGHGLEGDFNRKGTSNYSEQVGKPVASPLCTIVDDGTKPGLRGSLATDDEGTPTQHTILVQNGVLQGYLQDKHNASLMGVKPTGNGRRQSYAHLPMPRMTNTYLMPGEDEPEDIIKSVKKGLYAVNFGGGSVDITSGKFVFAASEAYLIEDGKVTRPVKGATLIGNGPDVMSKVSMIGHDLALDQGVGTCGKEGQSVPVGVGQPTLKVDEVVVGGTQ